MRGHLLDSPQNKCPQDWDVIMSLHVCITWDHSLKYRYWVDFTIVFAHVKLQTEVNNIQSLWPCKPYLKWASAIRELFIWWVDIWIINCHLLYYAVDHGSLGLVSSLVRELSALKKDSGSVLSTQMVVHNHLQLQFRASKALFWPPWSPGTHELHIHMCRQTIICIKLKIKKEPQLLKAHSRPIDLGSGSEPASANRISDLAGHPGDIHAHWIWKPLV